MSLVIDRTLPPFMKIIQSFILMQNTWKRDRKWVQEYIFGAPFFKKVAFWLILDANLGSGIEGQSQN